MKTFAKNGDANISFVKTPALGRIMILAAVIILSASLFPSSAPAATQSTVPLCGIALRPAFVKYKEAVERKYGSISCQISDEDFAEVEADTKAATIGVSKADYDDEVIVTHELLHLWLGTRGWSVIQGRPYGPPHKIPNTLNIGARGLIDELSESLTELMEHRVIVRMLHAGGLSERSETETLLQMEKITYGKGGRPMLIGASYLEIKLRDASVSQEYRQFLNDRGMSKALEAAELLQLVIARDNPTTQADAYKTVQDCIDESYSLQNVDKYIPRIKAH